MPGGYFVPSLDLKTFKPSSSLSGVLFWTYPSPRQVLAALRKYKESGNKIHILRVTSFVYSYSCPSEKYHCT